MTRTLRPVFTVWCGRSLTDRWCNTNHVARLDLGTGEYHADEALASAKEQADYMNRPDTEGYVAWVTGPHGEIVYDPSGIEEEAMA